MGLMRFGKSAIDPTAILAIEDETSRPGAQTESAGVTITLREATQQLRLFGDDASAVRQFVSELPDRAYIIAAVRPNASGSSAVADDRLE